MTQLLVLGLLKEKPLSGYDIQMALKSSGSESWGGVLVGSIYHALKRMEKEGYITVASVEQTGQRQKSVYRITENGVRHFEKLLLCALQNDSVCFPTKLYSGLDYLESLSGGQAVAALLLQKEALKKNIANLDSGRAEKAECMGGKLHPISELVFEHMRKTIVQQIDLIDSVIRLTDK